MAVWTGWLAALLVVITGSVPLWLRIRSGKRSPPEAPPMRLHVLVGLSTGAIAFFHTLLVVPVLGAPGAVGGGALALAAGGLAFFALVAHTGLGFQLRRPKLRRRVEIRRQHVTTAIVIAAAVALHAILLIRGSR